MYLHATNNWVAVTVTLQWQRLIGAVKREKESVVGLDKIMGRDHAIGVQGEACATQECSVVTL
jgi:hypothetical protein